MSAGFDSAVIRAPLLQLWLLSSSSSASSSSTTSSTSKAIIPLWFGVFFCSVCSHLCWRQQGLNLGSQAPSMRLRPKRTCSGAECFGGFHIEIFVDLFLFLRGDLT